MSSSRRSVRGAAAAVAVVACIALRAVPAAGQTPPANPVTAGWQDGFFIQSANGDFRLNFGLVAQADGRFVAQTRPTRLRAPSRSARPGPPSTAALPGTSISTSSPTLAAACRAARRLSRYAVQQRVPRPGRQEQDADRLRDPGRRSVSPVPGTIAGVRPRAESRRRGPGARRSRRRPRVVRGRLFNGIPDGTSSVVDLDAGDSKDLAGRVVVQPFRRTENPGSLNGLRLRARRLAGNSAAVCCRSSGRRWGSGTTAT